MTAAPALAPHAVGLGLRRGLLAELRTAPSGGFDFLEAAPENWIGVGGALGEAFNELAARQPIVCHGLSLSLGGPGPLDDTFLGKLRRFLDAIDCPIYSEHLSACSDHHGQLYDLMPLPFTDAAVEHVAARIRRAQDMLGRRIAVENISYYATLPAAGGMREIDFVRAVLERADCDLLLDVNNVVVNATNHGYDALAFVRALPADRIAYLNDHLSAALDAVSEGGQAEGMELRGYYVWSLMDNWEWAAGFTQRFGLIHVDFDSGQRTPKDSYRWLQQVLSARTATT